MEADLARKLRLGLWVLAGLFVIDVVEVAVGMGLRRGATLPPSCWVRPWGWWLP